TAFDSRHTIGRVGQGVEQVGFAPGGDIQTMQRFLGLAAICGEVGQDLGLDIVRHHGDVVLRLQRAGEAPGQVQRWAPSPAVPILLEKAAELDHHGHCQRRFTNGDAGDFLRHVVFEHAEVARRNAGDEVSLVVHYGRVNGDDINVAFEVGQVAGV